MCTNLLKTKESSSDNEDLIPRAPPRRKFKSILVVCSPDKKVGTQDVESDSDWGTNDSSFDSRVTYEEPEFNDEFEFSDSGTTPNAEDHKSDSLTVVGSDSSEKGNTAVDNDELRLGMELILARKASQKRARGDTTSPRRAMKRKLLQADLEEAKKLKLDAESGLQEATDTLAEAEMALQHFERYGNM